MEHVIEGSGVMIEGVRGPLAEEAMHSIAELTATPIEWKKSAYGSDLELHVIYRAPDADAVERGLFRAVLKVTGHGRPEASKTGWRKFLRRNS